MAYKVYEDRNNTIGVQLVKNGVKLTSDEMDAITNAGIIVDGTEYDYDAYATAFDWSTRKSEGVLIIALGAVLDAPLRDTKAEIVIYDATNTSGIIWDTIDIEVVDVG